MELEIIPFREYASLRKMSRGTLSQIWIRGGGMNMRVRGAVRRVGREESQVRNSSKE